MRIEGYWTTSADSLAYVHDKKNKSYLVYSGVNIGIKMVRFTRSLMLVLIDPT